MEEYLEALGNSTIYKNDYKLANSYEIGEWDPSTITKDITGGVITICAPTGAGKSQLVKHILSETHKDFEKIYLMCPTAKIQSVYDYIPRKNIIDTFNEEFLNKLWTTKKAELEREKEKMKRENIMVIIDDCIDLPEYKKSLVLPELSHGGRHAYIYVLLLSQDFNSISPTLRKNSRIAISFQLDSKGEREKLTKQYMSLENNHIGEILYKKITGIKYQCVVCLNYEVGATIPEKIKKFTANVNKKVNIKDKKNNGEFSTEVVIKKSAVYNPY